MVKRKSLGLNFSEQISKVTSKSGSFKGFKEFEWRDNLIPNFDPQKEQFEKSIWRVTIVLGLTAISFFAIFLRLFHLQIVQGAQNRQIADGNRIQIKLIHAPRGVIYDREGRVLAQNEPGFRLVNETGSKVTTLISREEALKMEVSSDPRFYNLEIDTIRSYPLGEKAAHILGYVGEISDKELKDPKYSSYKLGDRVGRGGVEQIYEDILRGTDGGEVIEVDANGKKLRSLRKTESSSGKNLYLTIDSQLQDVVFSKLKEALLKSGSCCGVAVVEDPGGGQILALVSFPSFDPTNITPYLNAANYPILNRAIGGLYPPGSTFKIASSLAGLQTGKITPSTQFEDTGEISLGIFKFSNWYFTQYGKKEGMVDLVKALKRSNDTFFYHVGGLVGEKALAQTAKELGMGKKLGIDLPGEESGLIPSSEWKLERFGEVWFPGDTLHMAIGQGFVLTSPLQISHLISAVAAGGKLYPPHLALKSSDRTGSKDFKYELTNLAISAENLSLVKKGLALVPQNGGTAWPFFGFPVPSAGKTGTAEYGNPNGKTHAWYSAFAPVNNPKIAVTVLIEGGGEGSSVSAPVVKEIMRWYFSEDKNNPIADVYPVATESARTLGE